MTAIDIAARDLEERIRSRTARVVVVGQGYVGLPLAVAAAEVGFPTLGYDVDPATAADLNQAHSHIGDISSGSLADLRRRGTYTATADPAEIAGADVYVICVPTPLRPGGAPDISYIESAAQTLAPFLTRGRLVILESTTYPGTTDEVLRPRLEEAVGVDGIFVAFSPERIDPGNPQFGLANTPKIVGGADEASGRLAATFYAQFVEEVVRVPGTREAEMAKLIENTFRHVNIALVNELAIFCREAGIDVHASIAAAATKPFGYMPFYPGPGVGGHCIPVDPNYLAWQFRQAGERFRLVEAAEEINSHMPHYVVRRIQSILNNAGRPLSGSRVVVVGVAYKANVADWRESPAIPVLEQLIRAGADVAYVDPFVPEITSAEGALAGVSLDEALREPVDCAVVLTAHQGIDYRKLVERSRTVYDTRAALRIQSPHIETL